MKWHFIFLILFSCTVKSQTDTLYFMNGQVIGEKVMDTLLGAITINDAKKPGKRLHYEHDQLYMVLFSDGYKRYYYQQDTLKYNWFTREEMWYFMKGERDSRRGFKPIGCAIGASIAGLLGGMSGTFWGPILPYGYMALSGITRIRINHKSVSHPNFLDQDAYILGYERNARQKRKIWSVIYGSAGLAVGYGFYAAFNKRYPESVQIKFLRIGL